MNSDFEKAKLKQERLTAASSAAGEVLRAFPRNAMGLVSDAVIESTGSELSYPGDASLYRSPQKAAAAARKHAEHDRTGE